TARAQLIAALNPLSGLDATAFGPLVIQVPQELTRETLESERNGSFYEIVNQAQQQYRAQQELTMRTMIIEALQQMTQQEKDQYADEQIRRNNTIDDNAEFIASGPIEALMRAQYPQYVPANANAGENRK